MDNLVERFKNNEFDVSVNVKGDYNNPLFRAKDIGTLLEMTNIRTVLSEFNDTEKISFEENVGHGPQITTYLTEKGLYKILFRSNKPIADKFKDYVCAVLHDLRIKGYYELEEFKKKVQELEEEKKAVKNVIYAFKLKKDKTDKEYKIGKSSNIIARERAFKTSSPTGEMIKEVVCEDINSSESLIHIFLNKHGAHIKGETYNMEKDMLFAYMDVVGILDKVTGISCTLEKLKKCYRSLYRIHSDTEPEPESVDIERDKIFKKQRRTKVVRINYSTKVVDKAYASVCSAAKDNDVKKPDTLRQAILKGELINGYIWREWRTGDPVPPNPNSSQRMIEKRDPITKEILDVFNSATDAGKSLTPPVGNTAILNCVDTNGRSGGFLWTHAELYRRSKNVPTKKVRSISKDGTITEYMSLRAASESTNISSSAISDCLRRQGTSGGKKWEFIET